MLILTRKSDESVVIGNGIEIKILSIRGDQVSLGFTAPRTVSIHRKEVFESIQHQNREAAGSDPKGLQEILLALAGSGTRVPDSATEIQTTGKG